MCKMFQNLGEFKDVMRELVIADAMQHTSMPKGEAVYIAMTQQGSVMVGTAFQKATLPGQGQCKTCVFQSSCH